MASPLTLVYHKVDELEIKLDLYLPTKSNHHKAGAALATIVAFHGGGLFIGDRRPTAFVPMWLHGKLV